MIPFCPQVGPSTLLKFYEKKDILCLTCNKTVPPKPVKFNKAKFVKKK